MSDGNFEKFGVDIKNLRKPYCNKEEPFLLEENLPSKNPFELFDIWFRNVAKNKNVTFEEVNAVCLSTVINNQPKSRMVLMKEYDREGLCFYTHYNSAKGMQIDRNPHASMLFYWPHVDRQVRMEGKLEKLPVEAAEAYWYHRPLKSRIGSKVSEQSKMIPNRQYLEDKKVELEKLVAEKGEEAITRPEDWGGYRLRPHYFEFWQGQTDRIHDRIVFEKGADETEWLIKRLSP
ncbi:pyridoxamine 5'-phosphate oxidase [Loa loa]|nr:pyridoxamine 5'-phosphate oxidase [Loa loa]EJD73561.1 pyridoxamine 5'-phosphate oxidase [Loa loa]